MRTSLPDGTTVELADGVRRLWRRGLLLKERPLTEDEAAQLAEEETVAVNVATVHDRLTAALEGNAAFLADATPTQASVLTQVRRLTRQTNALIHHAYAQHTDIADTGNGGP